MALYLYIAFSGFVCLIPLFLLFKRPRLVPGVYITGLDGGKRSLQKARQALTHSCADMMLEGYHQVQHSEFTVQW